MSEALLVVAFMAFIIGFDGGKKLESIPDAIMHEVLARSPIFE